MLAWKIPGNSTTRADGCLLPQLGSHWASAVARDVTNRLAWTLWSITSRWMRLQPRLSKSRYLAGLQCSRRLWLGWHDPEPRSEPQPGTVLAVGTDVGIAARLLVPGGILVDEGPDQHAQAVTRTRELIANPDVPAIFEAAFAFDNVLIRADILQRLPSGPCCSPKSSASG